MIGCFSQPFLLAGACVRLNGNRFYAMFFACVILLRLLCFLRTFLTQSIALRALHLDGNRALLLERLSVQGVRRNANSAHCA